MWSWSLLTSPFQSSNFQCFLGSCLLYINHFSLLCLLFATQPLDRITTSFYGYIRINTSKVYIAPRMGFCKRFEVLRITVLLYRFAPSMTNLNIVVNVTSMTNLNIVVNATSMTNLNIVVDATSMTNLNIVVDATSMTNLNIVVNVTSMTNLNIVVNATNMTNLNIVVDATT